MFKVSNRLTRLLSSNDRKLLSVFYTAGFPNIDSTVPIAVALEKHGADIIEIGIPFSDPVADGPTIQQSNKVALSNGMNTVLLIKQIREIREAGVKTPIVLMGYLNPVIQYGVEKFVSDCSEAGVDGLILPDMPLKEFEASYQSTFTKANISSTFLISPTTSEDRIRKIDDLTSGFVYAVSASSTTGARTSFHDDQVAYFKKIGNLKLKNPVLVGFGISNKITFDQASADTTGAIVGSAFIQHIKESQDLDRDIKLFINNLKG